MLWSHSVVSDFLWPHGWRSLVGYSPWGHKKSDTTEWLHNNLDNYSKGVTIHNCLSKISLSKQVTVPFFFFWNLNLFMIVVLNIFWNTSIPLNSKCLIYSQVDLVFFFWHIIPLRASWMRTWENLLNNTFIIF